jgi:beta-lactamase class A
MRSSPRRTQRKSDSPHSSATKVPGTTFSSPYRPTRPQKKNQPTIDISARRIENEKNYRHPRRKPLSPMATFLLYIIRLSILGIGISAIAGTALTIIKPSQTPIANRDRPQIARALAVTPAKNDSSVESLNQELTPLKAKLEALAAKYPKLKPGAFFIDLDNGSYVDLQSETVFSSASTIKIPILIAFFQDVDAGKVRLDEQLTMNKKSIASGSGGMQYQPSGKKYTALETATEMIVNSDNTATNMIIDRLGGKDALNRRFQEWGAIATEINNPLPDLKGTNTTSPRDLANLLAKINQGELVTLKSRDRILGIMQETYNRTLLPQGIEADAIISHKTGDIGTVLGDAGIVDMPSGKRYIGAILVKRPHNDYTARTLIQESSQTVYQHFKWYK